MTNNRVQKRKGIVLAGGKGTRLRPLTELTNKHLLNVYDRPMIMYPIATLKSLGIEEILIISGSDWIGDFAGILGDGSALGVSLTYRVQKEAGGIAQALGLARSFVGNDGFTMILGDNVFDNTALPRDRFMQGIDAPDGNALLVLAQAGKPEQSGVPEIRNGRIVAIEEKPQEPKSSHVVTGLYAYPSDVFDVISHIQPSARGELEITDVNNHYILAGRCNHVEFNGFWSDAGTIDSLVSVAVWAKQYNASRTNKTK